MGYVLLSSKHLLMEGHTTGNLNCLPHIIRYDDWSYELGIIEFEKEEKSFNPIQGNNNEGGSGCVFFVVLTLIAALVYYFTSV